MKVLVTGATGFLGSHLVAALVRRGDTVRVLCRTTSNTDRLPSGVEIVYGDLRNEDGLAAAIDGVDVVYHAGAAMRGSWQEYEQSTVNGTARMLELFVNSR
jgi:nucleoside-diphosphate-sugar epimerase